MLENLFFSLKLVFVFPPFQKSDCPFFPYRCKIQEVLPLILEYILMLYLHFILFSSKRFFLSPKHLFWQKQYLPLFQRRICEVLSFREQGLALSHEAILKRSVQVWARSVGRSGCISHTPEDLLQNRAQATPRATGTSTCEVYRYRRNTVV